MTDLRQRLAGMGEEGYAAFQRKLIPTAAPETVLGVRTPALRKLAKELVQSGEGGALLVQLPHRYLEEDLLHAFVLAEEKDFAACLEKTEEFLPYIENWAVCDQFSPKVFAKHREELLPHVERWLASERPYTVRFGIKALMDHFLDEAFDPRYLDWVAAISSPEYYVRMMRAWYFATALAKQWEAAYPVLAEKRLDPWVHRKTIQKAVESFRVPPERKEALKALRG